MTYCFTVILLSTFLTPSTAEATLTALSTCALSRTKPLSCTSPFLVSTTMSVPLMSASANSAVFTLVVMMLSSMTAPAEEAAPGPYAPEEEDVSVLPEEGLPAEGEAAGAAGALPAGVASLLLLPAVPGVPAVPDAAPAVLESALPAAPVAPAEPGAVPLDTPAVLLDVSGAVPVVAVPPAVLLAAGGVPAVPAAPVCSGASRPHPANAAPSNAPRRTALEVVTLAFMLFLLAYREPEPLELPELPELPEVPLPAPPDAPDEPIPELPEEPELPEVAASPEL